MIIFENTCNHVLFSDSPRASDLEPSDNQVMSIISLCRLGVFQGSKTLNQILDYGVPSKQKEW